MEMLGYAKRLPTWLTIVALTAALVACGKTDDRSVSSQPLESAAIPWSVASDGPEEPNLVPGDQSDFESSNATSAGSSVGVSNVQTPSPSSTDSDNSVEEKPFDSGHPMLHGISLHDNAASIEERFGSANAAYALPGENETIDMREYTGFSVGFNDYGDVVYIETTSSEVATGIAGLEVGMDGAKAAERLEILDHPDSHVLTMNVAEGWLKLDLDPDTHEVLSIKLIGSDS